MAASFLKSPRHASRRTVVSSIVTTATDAARRLRESSDPAAAPRTLYSHSDQVKVIALTAQWRRSRRRPAGCAHEASERGFFSVLRLEAAASSATARSPVRRGRLSLRARSVWVRATFFGLDGFAACLVRWLLDSRGRFSRAIGSRVRRSARLFAVPVVLATSWIVLTGSARGAPLRGWRRWLDSGRRRRRRAGRLDRRSRRASRDRGD